MSTDMPINKSTSSRKADKLKRHTQQETSKHLAITPAVIRVRAYEIFRARHANEGDHMTDWIQAERELTGAAQPKSSMDHSRGRHETQGRSKAKTHSRDERLTRA